MKRYKNDENVKVVKKNLRALLFWACVGVTKSNGGSYEKDIVNIIKSYAEYIRFTVPYQLRFNEWRERG